MYGLYLYWILCICSHLMVSSMICILNEDEITFFHYFFHPSSFFLSLWNKRRRLHHWKIDEKCFACLLLWLCVRCKIIIVLYSQHGTATKKKKIRRKIMYICCWYSYITLFYKSLTDSMALILMMMMTMTVTWCVFVMDHELLAIHLCMQCDAVYR